MKIHVDDYDADLISELGTPSPDKKKMQQRLAAPQILLNDTESGDELIVYEDDGGSGSSPNLSPRFGDLGQTSKSLWKDDVGKKDANKKADKPRPSAAKNLIAAKKSWLTSTQYFQRAIDSSFDMIDVDKSGDVSLEELYAGLLLIHLKMAIYVGAPACRPASKEYVSQIFRLLDSDNSGTLTREEFGTVMKILYSQVFTRIVIQWTLTLLIVPVVTQYIIKYTLLLCWIAHEFWKDIDDDLDPIQRLLWKVWDLFLYITPRQLDRSGELICILFAKIPGGVWKTMPYTIITVAQTSVVLPLALNRVENFFRRVAHRAYSQE